jgi:hypothetical protein
VESLANLWKNQCTYQSRNCSLSISHKDFSTLILWCSQVLNPIAYESDQLLPMNFRTCILLAILLSCQNFSSSSTMPLQAIWLTRSTIALSYSLAKAQLKLGMCKLREQRDERVSETWEESYVNLSHFISYDNAKNIYKMQLIGKKMIIIYLNVNKVLLFNLIWFGYSFYAWEIGDLQSQTCLKLSYIWTRYFKQSHQKAAYN